MQNHFVAKVIALIAIAAPLTPVTHAVDVFGTDSNYIKVTESTSREEVGFSFCSLSGAFACRQVGKRAFYSKSELKKLRSSESWDVLKAIGADVVIVAATVATGGAVAYAGTAGAGAGATIYGTLAGAAAGGATGIVAAKLIDAINPHEQNMQTKTLKDDVLNDKRVDLDYAVGHFYRRLETVLDNLE